VGGRCGRGFRRRARVRTCWSTAGAVRAELIGEAHSAERERTGTRGQRLNDWQNRPAKKRDKRGARAKKLALIAWPHWAASERERERRVWGSLAPIGGVRLSGAADARARATGSGGLVWAELTFSISLEFLIAFSIPFSLGFSFQIQFKFQIQTNSNMCNNSKNI
jgi:hypothetical protein